MSPKPAFPEWNSLRALEGVEAAKAGQAHGHGRSSDEGSRNARSLAVVGDILQGLGEAEDLLRVGEKPSENAYTSRFSNRCKQAVESFSKTSRTCWYRSTQSRTSISHSGGMYTLRCFPPLLRER